MSCPAKKVFKISQHIHVDVKCELDRPKHRESHRGVYQDAIIIWALTPEEKENADVYRVGGIDK